MINEAFNKWAKGSPDLHAAQHSGAAIAYTRVSSKEQAEKTLSLSFQAKVIQAYSERSRINILEWFGGTFESAKTDGRKEFQRLLDFIKGHKGSIRYLLVYTTDRFSRTGPDAMKLADQLRKKYGVYIIAVTQPVDTTNPHGIFQQNLQLLFSEYDNQLRKQRAVAGMKEKMERGIWCIRPPFGYTIIRDDKGKRIVVNEQGHILRKAFEWKSIGVKNQVILKRLKRLGVKLYKQKLGAILSNPFYAGIIVTKLLDGKTVEGTHEKLIPPELFLKVNNIKSLSMNGYGVSPQKEIDALPLKVFLKCSRCESGYTGFLVKTKNIWYYKCRSAGCTGTVNAAHLNNLFLEFLSGFSIKKEYLAPLRNYMNSISGKLKVDSVKELQATEKLLTDLEQKINSLEEKFYITEQVNKEIFEKFHPGYQKEKIELVDFINTLKPASHTGNFETQLYPSIHNLADIWKTLTIVNKEKLQNLIFPAGLVFSKATKDFQAKAINPLFTNSRMVYSQIAA